MQLTITEHDPTTWESLRSLGTEQQQVWDYRIEDFATYPFHVFVATYTDGTTDELWINAEDFTFAVARTKAEGYAADIGRTPYLLRQRFDRFYLSDGPETGETVGAGAGTVLTRDGEIKQVWGILWYDGWFDDDDGRGRGYRQEVLIHELAHLSLTDLGATDAWIAAQEADGRFVSPYAAQHPTIEDVAETMEFYVAVRYRRHRIGEANALAIEAAIPNRLAVLDAQDWSGLWCPLVPSDCGFPAHAGIDLAVSGVRWR